MGGGMGGAIGAAIWVALWVALWVAGVGETAAHQRCNFPNSADS